MATTRHTQLVLVLYPHVQILPGLLPPSRRLALRPLQSTQLTTSCRVARHLLGQTTGIPVPRPRRTPRPRHRSPRVLEYADNTRDERLTSQIQLAG